MSSSHTTTPITTLSHSLSHSLIDSPVGQLALVTDGQALTGVYMQEHRHTTVKSWGERVGRREAADVVQCAGKQLDEYFTGERQDFDLPLAAVGTEFQRAVWAGLREIPYGETWTYGQLAAHLGRAGASRAVGLANGRNPISIIVPCHRVIGADGSMTGYGGGVPRKEQLLALERGGQLPLDPGGQSQTDDQLPIEWGIHDHSQPESAT
ncbi:methylated-DNA--[protein]-cysteine S-methyltransferase [Nesterenkonia xinjiangensis]|uniref:Methylated-DNA--protein-cysteine methyltransferase n=1 Tax=Nesterenkonia xinjiangensis TaxID=225327 RepID=A0A7Z0K915_9MICC|nr:methylated-DNA--[protein]-cysteine S-methyltransferase [Nesterenkonia xinjiangensis]NYJ78274.1 methylated-DNA-[protein]-cysteine S-methyltransferase [Nesterenkonia xinjiangensis]